MAERLHTRVFGFVTEFILDAEESIILGGAFGAAGRPRLYLARPQPRTEVGDGGVLGLTGAVADHGRPAGLPGRANGLDGLGESADLVKFDEDRIGGLQTDALFQSPDIGHVKVIADQLDFTAQLFGD